MKKFEVLCVTMHQNDFSLFEKMKINADAVFANQTDHNLIECAEINGHNVKMVSTDTRGVGLNRNISLLSATAEICLLGDDDMVYREGYDKLIIEEFEKHPKADVIVFNIGCSTPQYGRIPTVVKNFKRFHKFSKNPFGAPRIAFRLSAIKRSNVAFSLLFGGGALYPSGEDTIWLESLLNAGLKIYLSPIFIGDVAYGESSWFDAAIEKKLYGYGAMLRAKKTALWQVYMLRYALKAHKKISFFAALKLISKGYGGYDRLISYEDYINRRENN